MRCFVALLGAVVLQTGCGESRTGNASPTSPGATAGAAGEAGSPGVDGGAGGEGGASPFPSDQAIDQVTFGIARDVCERLFACCEQSYIDALYESESDCIATYSGTLRVAIGNNRDAVLEGRLAIDLGAADNCAGEPITCDESPWACSAGLIMPLVELGGACEFPNQCIEGSCDNESKTCQPKREAGEPCFVNEDCTSGRCSFAECAPPSDTPVHEECVD